MDAHIKTTDSLPDSYQFCSLLILTDRIIEDHPVDYTYHHLLQCSSYG